jgi:hypothetical protein
MMDQDRVLRELPYRMQSIAALHLALNLSATLGAAPMKLYAGEKLVVEGSLHGFTNPAIEAGIMHCRALLEFLGLCDNKGKLDNRTGRRPTDIGIEHFKTPAGVPLKIVTPDDAANRYPGPSDEAKSALPSVFQVANKELSHVTEDLRDSPEHARLIEIASRGIPVLMIGCFYKPLGLPVPEYNLTHRSRYLDDTGVRAGVDEASSARSYEAGSNRSA